MIVCFIELRRKTLRVLVHLGDRGNRQGSAEHVRIWKCHNPFFVKSRKYQILKMSEFILSESENVRIHQDRKVSVSENDEKCQNLKMSEYFKTGKCRNWVASKYSLTGKCQNRKMSGFWFDSKIDFQIYCPIFLMARVTNTHRL